MCKVVWSSSNPISFLLEKYHSFHKLENKICSKLPALLFAHSIPVAPISFVWQILGTYYLESTNIIFSIHFYRIGINYIYPWKHQLLDSMSTE